MSTGLLVVIIVVVVLVIARTDPVLDARAHGRPPAGA